MFSKLLSDTFIGTFEIAVRAFYTISCRGVFFLSIISSEVDYRHLAGH